MAKIILSKHALERAQLRGIELSVIEKVILNPEHKINLKDGKFKFIKKIYDRHYQVIASEVKKENKWIVISVWVRGENDRIPLIWTLISAPFRLFWWILKKLIKAFLTILAKTADKK